MYEMSRENYYFAARMPMHAVLSPACEPDGKKIQRAIKQVGCALGACT